MVAAYKFLDAVVSQDLDLFSEEGLEPFCSSTTSRCLVRDMIRASSGDISPLTRHQFFDNFRRYVKPIRRWYRKHETDNPYKVAAQVYVGVLSQPQLH